ILFSISVADLSDKSGNEMFLPGSCWKEESSGINAIGISLIEKINICVNPNEHDIPQLKDYCTCAAPILDHKGDVAGTLAVLTKCESTQLHTLGFIRTTAVLVENRMLVGSMTDKITLFFHPESNNIGTIKQCIAVFDDKGMLVGTNSAARQFLSLEMPVLRTKRFNDIFKSSFSLVHERNNNGFEQIRLCLQDGRLVNVELNRKISNTHGSGFRDQTATQSESLNTPAGKTQSSGTRLLLSDLDTGDPQMHAALEKARRIIGLDLPLMIEGESGVGKEMFTRAFH